MNIDNSPGRHRAPGGYSPLGELKSIARGSAQPAMKGAAVFAAAGGLVATLTAPASAETVKDASAPVAAPVAAPKAAAAIGPDAATAPAVTPATALSSIGYAAPAPKKAAKAKPIVIKDVVVEKARKEAAEKARKEAAEKARREAAEKARLAAAEKAREEAAARASRTTSRTSLTTTTYTPKTTVNATSGKKSSYNWATAGQCTWGALNKWYQSEGYYPGGFTGNAMDWAWGAANAGYTVSGTPRTRSILVMQPGVHGSSSVGHVAWVTAVNGNQVTIIEMNALAGPYNYNTRTLTDISGMKYIYAP